MIRKQIYLDAESERKLKALARSQRCSEAEIIRIAIRRLPDPPDGVEAALEALGFRHWEPDEAEEIPGEEELRGLHQKLANAACDRQAGLSAALIEDRAERV